VVLYLSGTTDPPTPKIFSPAVPSEAQLAVTFEAPIVTESKHNPLQFNVKLITNSCDFPSSDDYKVR
jgi:hypothetical protein